MVVVVIHDFNKHHRARDELERYSSVCDEAMTKGFVSSSRIVLGVRFLQGRAKEVSRPPGLDARRRRRRGKGKRGGGFCLLAARGTLPNRLTE
jgi:hypothetical protein